MPDISTQQLILDRWITALSKLPEIEVVWLEGSLVEKTHANPGSDIDVRLGIADHAYEALWGGDKQAVLAGLGEILRLINRDWIRALTAEGVIVEIAARRTSELAGLALTEWEFLLNRLPAGQPTFAPAPKKSAAATWPTYEPVTPAYVWQQTEIALVILANCPGPFYNGELHSIRFTLGDMRTELVKLMFQRIGLAFAKRYKHLSEVLPVEFLQDLDSTYVAADAGPADLATLAEETLRTLEMRGKHLNALSQQAGGGFEAAWYQRLLAQTRTRLQPFLTQ